VFPGSRALVLVLTSALVAAAGHKEIAFNPVTFNRDVAPILQKHCQSCHRPGQAAPMALLTYQDARPWAKAIRNAVASRKMPPWFADSRYGHFTNDPSLPETEVETLVNWANDGALEGDPRGLPPRVEWAEGGWQIQPDVIVSLPAYRVPAKGIVDWTYVTVPSGFAKDTWVTSIEILPGDPVVLHHAAVFVKPHKAGQQVTEDAPADLSGLAALYVPGFRAMDYRVHHAAQLVRANTDLVVQLHYTPNGKGVTDVTRVGFTLAKEPPQRRFITYSPQPPAISDRNVFRIPAGDPNWSSPPVDGVFQVDAGLVWFMPHMHLRGKDMTYSLINPGGKPEIVLSVRNYDFTWQTGYEVASPIPVTKGTRLHVEAHYDNSANNKANPDATQDVYGGSQTWEEMMVPFFGVVVDARVDPRKVMTIPGQAGAVGTGR
jgi:hypothetical protein